MARGRVPLTLSGGVTTDVERRAARLLGLTASGQMCDGLLEDGSLGVRRAATNLFRHGQNGANTDVVAGGAGVTIGAPTTAVPFPFSPQSIPIVCDGIVAQQGAYIVTASGQAAAVGVNGVGSVRFQGVAGQSYSCALRWRNTDASTGQGTVVNFAASGGVQLLGDALGGVALAALAVAAGKTGDRLELRVFINGQRAETFYLGHGMLEKGQSVVAPYVATSGGSTATHPASRVQASASLLDETRGWVAMRVRHGFPSTADAYAGAFPVLFNWRDDATHEIAAQYDVTNDRFRIVRRNGGADQAFTAAQTFAAGDLKTVLVSWTATTVGISVDGGAFVSVASANIPTLAAATFDIGSRDGTTVHMDSDVLWFACGTGSLTDQDTATIHRKLAGHRLKLTIGELAAMGLNPTAVIRGYAL